MRMHVKKTKIIPPTVIETVTLEEEVCPVQVESLNTPILKSTTVPDVIIEESSPKAKSQSEIFEEEETDDSKENDVDKMIKECLIQCINHAVEDAAIIGEMERLLMEENRLIETNFQCGECGNIFIKKGY